MPNLVSFEDVSHFFENFKHTAWRLETQRAYASDLASPNWPRFQRGETFGYSPDSPWHVNVREQTMQGKRFERVRLVDQPPTEGQRFLLASGLGNVEAGEDVRNLYRSDAERMGLPEYDFWLFDSRSVVKFVIDNAGRTLGVHVLEDAESVVHACQVRDAAWHHAVPTREFQAQVPSSV